MAGSPAAHKAEMDCLSPEAQRLAEARLAAKRAARAEAREIRMKELERQQKEASDEDERMSVGSRGSLRVEERPDKDFTEKVSRDMPSLSAATLASLGGTSSRRGSGDTSISIDTEASIREIKDSLAEVEEKYKKAMVSNAQLDNEKMKFMYQVDTLKDVLMELEEELAESRRQYEEKSKEFEREKHAHSVLRFQFAEVQEALKQREEMLEKHGIILNSEIATNGETSGLLNNVSHQGSTKMSKEELNVLKSTADGALGRAKEVEVENAVVTSVRQDEVLPDPEHQQHREDRGQDGGARQGLRPSDQKVSEDTTPSPGAAANGNKEEEGQGVPGDGTGLSPEAPTCLRSDLGSESFAPVLQQHCDSTLGLRPETGESAEHQQEERQKDFKTCLGEISTKPDQESVPLLPAEAEGQHGGPAKSVIETRMTAGGEHVGPVSSSPPHQGDTEHKAEMHGARDPGDSCGPEKELASQERAGPQKAPTQHIEVDREKEGEGEVEPVGDELSQTEAETLPCPLAEGNWQNHTGVENEPLDLKEPEEDKSQQGEALDSPQKKTKNKKKKNKKKKPPVPAETLRDDKEQSASQNADLGDVKAREQVQVPDREATGSPSPVTEEAAQGAVGGSESRAGPPVESDGNQNREEDDVEKEEGKGLADGDVMAFEDDTIPSSGVSASDKESEESVVNGSLGREGDAQSSARELEDEVSSRPSEEFPDAPQTESPERSRMSGQPDQDLSLGKPDSPIPAGEPGDLLESCHEGDPRAGNEKAKSKEDCTMS